MTLEAILRRRSAFLLAALALGLAACAPARPPVTPAPTHARVAGAEALVPVPLSLTLAPADTFRLDTTAVIVVQTVEPEAARVAYFLAGLIGNTATTTPKVLVQPGAAPPGSIELALDAARSSLGEEGYELTVDAARVRIVAAAPAGLFYGVQTLRQLLPAAIEYSAALPRRMQLVGVRITDEPRFAWRGAMLDVARHFRTVDEVKRFIDLLAIYKLNRLHLHLADDQGWRIEIPSWPNLTQLGGSTQVGGLGGGFYTREQYAEIVSYARERFIQIVPEIDMPGHTNAALASVPELNCDGVAPPLYTGTRVGFSALCVTKDTTYAFIDDVVRELAEITPGEFFHIGGDEVQKLTHDEYRTFIERVQGIVQSHGKRVIGWGEIAPANLPPSVIVQHWKADSAAVAVARGSKVILSPAKKLYLDMQYDTSTPPIGLHWAAYIELKDAYDWEPGSYLAGVPESAILGLEAPLWAETIGSIHDVEYLAFPRLAAVAELAWSPAELTEWESFRARLAAHLPRWNALGINYYPSPQLR